MKQRKKRPVPPPPPVVVADDLIEKMQDEDELDMPQMQTPMYDMDDPVYQERHALAQEQQLRSAQEGFVLLKNTGVLPLPEGAKLNVFGRHAGLFFTEEVCKQYGVEMNMELFAFYAGYKTRDPGTPVPDGMRKPENMFARTVPPPACSEASAIWTTSPLSAMTYTMRMALFG